MTDPAMMPAIRAAIQANELGPADPYALSFAGKAESGASYGICQNDTHANPAALATLQNILSGAGLAQDQIDRVSGLLSEAQGSNPLTPADAAAVDAALHSLAGRAAVDALDQKQFDVLGGYLDKAVAAAGGFVTGEAQLAICMWCNMTGAPTTLLTWIAGAGVDQPGGHVDPPGQPVSLDDMTRFLRASKYFTQHPNNWRHFAGSVAIGAKLLPQ